MGISRQHADKFIKVFESYDMSTCHLRRSLDWLYHLATLLSDERERQHTIPSSGATKMVDEMTVRELREVKAELKQ